MSQAVYEHAHANGFSVVREIGGHGIGLEFHEDPWVGYIQKSGTGMLLVPGMMFTIEPMINMGSMKFMWMTVMAGLYIRKMAFRPHSGKLWCW